MARRTACVNNLKQIATAMASYDGDYAGCLPCYPGWAGPDYNWCNPRFASPGACAAAHGAPESGYTRYPLRFKGSQFVTAREPDGASVQPVHSEGYNVLYGDWHVKWYGDPQERVIWHRQGGTSASTGTNGTLYTLGMNYYYGYLNHWRWGVDYDAFKDTAKALWHDLDVDAGVDVGVAPGIGG